MVMMNIFQASTGIVIVHLKHGAVYEPTFHETMKLVKKLCSLKFSPLSVHAAF